MDEYLELAKLTINAHGKSFKRFLLSSEDAISYVAQFMMYADLKWKPGAGSSQNTWRIQHGIHGIQIFLHRAKKNKRHLHILPEEEHKVELDNQLDTIIHEEEKETMWELLDQIPLTEKERRVLIYKMDGGSLTQLAKQDGVSKQSVSQLYRKAIKKVENFGRTRT